jgi:hypothetical protein
LEKMESERRPAHAEWGRGSIPEYAFQNLIIKNGDKTI